MSTESNITSPAEGVVDDSHEVQELYRTVDTRCKIKRSFASRLERR